MSIRKHFWTRKDLDNNNVSIQWDSNNQPVIIQDLPPKQGRGKKWVKERKFYDYVKEHPFGKPYVAKLVSLKLYDKIYLIPVSNVVWIYTYGSITDGDVDHIDSNTSNNSLDNLQLISHQENLRRKLKQGNQYNKR